MLPITELVARVLVVAALKLAETAVVDRVDYHKASRAAAEERLRQRFGKDRQ